MLGADTVVCLDGALLGKPKQAARQAVLEVQNVEPRDAADAAAILRRLSGREHVVYTGACLIAGGKEYADVAATRVVFSALSEELIRRYVASGLPMDKAGAYGIQDGYPLVARYEGSFSNVVGLPVELLGGMLRAARLL